MRPVPRFPKPHPPIYLGGESPAALRRLATYGDAWLPRAHTPPEQIRQVREWLIEQGRHDVPFTVFAADTDEGTLRGYAEAGVDEITLTLDTLPEADTLRSLDALAAVAAAHH